MEKHIKERLVGAVVLVAIVVIAVPELLTGPRERSSAEAPLPVAAPVRTVTIDLETGEQRDAVAADRIGDAPSASSPDASVSTDSSDLAGETGALPRGAVERPPAPSAEASAERAPPTSMPSGGDEMRAPADAPASAPAGASTGAPVRAAPDAGAGAATTPTAPKPAAVAGTKPADPTLASAAPAPKSAPSKASPAPVATPPRPAAPSTSAAEGWVVQLGSFASRPNAERLVTELRAKGYAGFVSEFRGSGRVLYRVRVGPEQDRARAEAIAQRLAREGKKGSIAPHP